MSSSDILPIILTVSAMSSIVIPTLINVDPTSFKPPFANLVAAIRPAIINVKCVIHSNPLAISSGFSVPISFITPTSIAIVNDIFIKVEPRCSISLPAKRVVAINTATNAPNIDNTAIPLINSPGFNPDTALIANANINIVSAIFDITIAALSIFFAKVPLVNLPKASNNKAIPPTMVTTVARIGNTLSFVINSNCFIAKDIIRNVPAKPTINNDTFPKSAPCTLSLDAARDKAVNTSANTVTAPTALHNLAVSNCAKRYTDPANIAMAPAVLIMLLANASNPFFLGFNFSPISFIN